MSKTATHPVEVLEPNDGLPSRGGRPPIKLDTVSGCIEELGRLYRDARHGRIDAGRAAKLGYLLQILVRAHESASLESRVSALEGVYEKS